MVVKLDPPLKNYIWGGKNLTKKWNKQSDTSVAESWELSFNEDGASVICSGQFCGKTLSQVVSQSEWGRNCSKFTTFPLLNKLIDAANNLSVQVHPNDQLAMQLDGQPYGKTEVWCILEAEEGASIYLGLKQDVTQQQLVDSIVDGSIMQLLNKVPVRSGDVYAVPSGTLHAIGSGVTLFEAQQNSTLTYRVYDYGRVDANGNPRQLHVDKALKSVNLSRYIPTNLQGNGLLFKCKYFSLYKYSGANKLTFPNSFCSLTVVDGEICVGKLTVCKGETIFASAGENIKITGNGTYLLTCVESEQ